ncbi:hypothetical protein DRJ16_00075 [Candidatus Woesearchaeota archaeon]|nr:MAG: hypothetical protein DRJ16_00075 [Candidatus Woesearchaeota archaeon]
MVERILGAKANDGNLPLLRVQDDNKEKAKENKLPKVQKVDTAEARIAETGSYKNLRNFVGMLKKFQEKDMDLIIPITAPKGFGKSTLMLEIIRTYVEEFMGFKERQIVSRLHEFIAYDNEEVMKNILDMNKAYWPLGSDEAVWWMMAEDWAKAESKRMKKIIAQARDPFHRIILACIPDFWWIDKKYREDMIFFWLHIVGRGVAIIFTPDLKIGIKDKWHRKEFEKIKGTINIFTPPDKAVKLYSKHPCFMDVLKFPKCDKMLYDRYLKLKYEHTTKVEEEKKMRLYVRRMDISQMFILHLLGSTNRDISTIMRIPVDTVEKVIAEFKRVPRYQELKKIVDNNLKPKKI